MIKSMLVSIDGSRSSNSALRIAGSVAGITDARLIGIFVQDEARFINQAAADRPKQEAAIENESLELHQSFQDTCDNARIRSRFLCRRGDPATEIAEVGRTVDFIIIGNAGKHEGVPEKGQGFTTNALMRVTTRPVLVVPDEPEGESKMVIAYDGSPSSERVLRAAAEAAMVAQLDEIHLVTISEDAEQARNIQGSAARYLSAYDISVVPALFRGHAPDVIVDYTESVDASVLALGAFGNRCLQDCLFGSTTLSVLDRTHAAVLLMN